MSFRVVLLSTPLLLAACGGSDSSSVEPSPDDGAAMTQVATATDPVEAFLAENAAREAVTVTGSGLQYEVVVAATGPRPEARSNVTIDYVGTLTDGTEFDSSIERGEPATFPLGGIIAGLAEGLQLMSVGSRYRFVLPADLAYGDAGAGQSIGPGATLIFVVDLLEINS